MLQPLSAMSSSQVSKEDEMKCVLHWFQGWSHFQKQDFMKDLVEKAVPQKVSTLLDAMDMLNVRDKPPSIFQCQLKLFNQWFEEWNDKDRNDFMVQIELIDPEFVARFNEEVASTSGQP